VSPENEDRFFLVDWVLPTASMHDVREAQHALEEASRRMVSEGEPVRCLRSTYLPRQQRWLCLFVADSAETVRKTHEIAQIPIRQVEEAVELPVSTS
jgi:hypothetical protein